MYQARVESRRVGSNHRPAVYEGQSTNNLIVPDHRLSATILTIHRNDTRHLRVTILRADGYTLGYTFQHT